MPLIPVRRLKRGWGEGMKKKLFRIVGIIAISLCTMLLLLSLIGTVAEATGLVDDTVESGNLYSQYSLGNYQLDFFVDSSWDWLPWNWGDGLGKSVMYGLYAITNFIWSVSLYLSNATGYVVQEAYKLDFISDTAESIGKWTTDIGILLWVSIINDFSSRSLCGVYRIIKTRNH